VISPVRIYSHQSQLELDCGSTRGELSRKWKWKDVRGPTSEDSLHLIQPQSFTLFRGFSLRNSARIKVSFGLLLTGLWHKLRHSGWPVKCGFYITVFKLKHKPFKLLAKVLKVLSFRAYTEFLGSIKEKKDVMLQPFEHWWTH